MSVLAFMNTLHIAMCVRSLGWGGWGRSGHRGIFLNETLYVYYIIHYVVGTAVSVLIR